MHTDSHTHTHKSISRNDYAEERTLSRNCPVSCVCRVFERFRRVISCSVSVLVTSFLLQQSRMTILQRQTAQKAIAKIATFRKTKQTQAQIPPGRMSEKAFSEMFTRSSVTLGRLQQPVHQIRRKTLRGHEQRRNDANKRFQTLLGQNTNAGSRPAWLVAFALQTY